MTGATLWRRILAFLGFQRKPKHRVRVCCQERIRRAERWTGKPDGKPRHLTCLTAEVPPILAMCDSRTEIAVME